MAKTPVWATKLVEEVCKDYGRRRPALHWRRSKLHANSWHATGRCYWGSHIVVTAVDSAQSTRYTLLHELAHWLRPAKETHSTAFWALLFELVARYGRSLTMTRARSLAWLRGSKAGYREYRRRVREGRPQLWEINRRLGLTVGATTGTVLPAAAPLAAQKREETQTMAKARFKLDKRYDREARWWYVGIIDTTTDTLVALPQELTGFDPNGNKAMHALDCPKIDLDWTVAKVREAMVAMEHDADFEAQNVEGVNYNPETDYSKASDLEPVEDDEASYEDALDVVRENVGDVETLEAEEAYQAEVNAAEQAAIEAAEPALSAALDVAATDGAARFEGTYKGVWYRAVQQADGLYYVVDVVGDSMTSRQRTALVASAGFKSLSNAGHAVAGAVLDALGLERKNPPARATFKLVSGTVQERVATAKSNTRKPLVLFKRSPLNHVPEGCSRWYCNGCAASFVVEGFDEPKECPAGHNAQTLAVN